MRLIAILVFGLALSGVARADDFKLRVGEADVAARAPLGATYQQSLAPLVARAIQACVPPGTVSPQTQGKFVLVANVSRAGAASAGAVQPATAVSRCFAAQFLAGTLPPPPGPTGGTFEYPIAVEVDVTP